MLYLPAVALAKRGRKAYNAGIRFCIFSAILDLFCCCGGWRYAGEKQEVGQPHHAAVGADERTGPAGGGAALLEGRSATQIADFVRRTAELLALVAAFIVYRRTADLPQESRRAAERRSNRFVGAVMCLSGLVMGLLALAAPEGDKGNVVPGLVIALLGAVANTLFWRKYARLSRESGNAILAVQSRLYRAKSLVDTVVTLALTAVLCFPGSAAAALLDRIGSAIVALYLLCCGLRTWREQADAE